MNADAILKKIFAAVEVLVEAGNRYRGLFPSLIDLKTHEMLQELPPVIPGQRNGDRAHPGSNLIHDQVVLKTMCALSECFHKDKYAQAADRYLYRFATHCTDTKTGLFPWGEHSFWHLIEDRVGNSHLLHDPDTKSSATHDHLRQAPLWMWEKIYQFNPRCVERFAEGLAFHWKEGEPLEYTRHAPIEAKMRHQHGERSCDFPRHSGFYIFDLSFAYLKTEREDFLEQIHRFLDYWWEKRESNGLLKIESRSPQNDTRFFGVLAPGQTISLAASLLESAQMLHERQPALAAEMCKRATLYIDGFFAAPHDIERGVFILACKHGDDADFRKACSESRNIPPQEAGNMPIWGSQYGVWPASYIALTCLCAYQLREDSRLLQWALAVGSCYLKEPFPQDKAVPAMDAGLGLGLLAALYDITSEKKWIRGGLELADKLINIYLDQDLPRGAAGIDWYESQMGPGFLLHSLAKIALLEKDKENCPLKADYTAR
ncbi:hypothetical protein ACFLQR_04160 [Verrucomicrobiota bacterium]